MSMTRARKRLEAKNLLKHDNAKASDRIKAKDHRQQGILGGCVVGCSLNGTEELAPWKAIIGFHSLLQAL